PVSKAAHQIEHRLVRLECLEVDLAKAMQLRAVAELGLEPPGEGVEELPLGDLTSLEAKEPMLALALADALHRPAQLLHRDARLVLEGGERLDQAVGEDTAEVADHGADRRCAAHPATSW